MSFRALLQKHFSNEHTIQDNRISDGQSRTPTTESGAKAINPGAVCEMETSGKYNFDDFCSILRWLKPILFSRAQFPVKVTKTANPAGEDREIMNRVL